MHRKMTERERQEFLAGPRVAVLSVASGGGRPPHATPVNIPVGLAALVAGPSPAPAALNSGYHAAFLAGAGCVLAGALIAATLLQGDRRS